MSRPQHVYAIHRLLTDPSVAELRLDGPDDLQLYDQTGRRFELVRAGEADDAFFARARGWLRETPEARQRLVSFGPVPRLVQALTADTLDGEARTMLERQGFSRKQIDAFRAVFTVDEMPEPQIEHLALLGAWLETQTRVTAVDVRDRLEAIARFHTDELPLGPGEGLTTPKHVVVIHGGTRDQRAARARTYLGPLSFAFRDVETVRALAAQSRPIGVPLVILVDGTPGWTGIVEELRVLSGVQVVATASASAWLRARKTGATLLYDEVALEGDEPEAVDEGPHAELVRAARQYLEEHADLIADVQRQVRSRELTWALLDPAGLRLLDAEQIFSSTPESRAWYEDVVRRKPAAPVVFEEVEDRQSCLSRREDRQDCLSSTDDVERFRRETRTAAITDDGTTATAHWIAPLEDDAGLSRQPPTANRQLPTFDLPLETIRRIDRLHRLQPDHQTYAAAVYGNVVAEMKRAVPAEQFPNVPRLRAHLLFAHLGSEPAWDDYVAAIVDVRSRIAAMAARITGALTTWFRRDKPFTIFEAGVDAEEWDAILAALASLPKMPRSAVDDLGVETEGPLRAWSAGTPHAHAAYEQAFYAYASAVQDFFAQSWRFFVANPQIGRGTPEGRAKVEAWLAEQNISRDVPTERLADAIRRLEAMQREFRARFGTHGGLEAEERERLWELWAVWYDFAFYPRRKLANAVKESTAAIDARIGERRRTLRRRFRELTLGKVEIHSEEPRGLWLTIDVEHVPNVVNAFAEALVHVIDVLRPPDEMHAFDRYVLDLVWERVHLVPLVRGKSLDRKQWSLPILGLPRPDEDLSAHAWKFVLHPIDDEAWQALGLEAWPSSLATEARRLAPAVAAWRDALAHLVALRDVPLTDDLGREIVTQEWREIVARADAHAERVQSILPAIPQEDAAATLLEFVKSIRTLLANAEPLAFETAAEAKTAVAETLVPAANAIGDVWIDGELP